MAAIAERLSPPAPESLKDSRAVGAARESREERVLLLPAGYEAGRLSACGLSQGQAGKLLV